MSSRAYIVNRTANTQPSGQQLGDEWFDVSTNRLYKQVAVSGSSVTSSQVLMNVNNTVATTGNISATGTITGVFIPVINSIASSTTITPTATSAQYNVTALATAATIAAPSGTPSDGQRLMIRIKDDGTARALTWTTTSGAYRAVGVTLPTTTVITQTHYIGCLYNSQVAFWDVVAVTVSS